ncbi:hypothetical protein ISN45_Aa07g030990 [Arabidopsis thaliana x Arabidopsis arenosa]|uniref:Arabidopsis retrotransposon Orf1 C-terminal domain-containing protein n=1 Tax=Arabidopsis thaliana x Arabidopsis arenosa TaxID=1240361 RepID=A0A8T1YBI3_9BRAS|nr:hypothetical protein ISN45_Aa07g030990 [Arabidopsis thaliana x Arabidopsis arenosa]
MPRFSRLLIHEEKNRVILAEACKDFVDVLCSLLTLPMGTIVRLLDKHHQNLQSSIVGCFHNLYKSVFDMDVDNFETQARKKLLLCPKSIKESNCRKLKLNVDDTEATRDKGAVFGISGVVSVILEACGIDLKEHTPVAGDNRIDLAFLGRTHYLGGWVDNPLQFAYRFTASYENEQIFLLSSPLLPSIKPGSTPFPPPESSFYVATSNIPLLLLSKYFARERKSMRNVAKQPSNKWFYSSISRLEKNQARLEGKLACQSLIITKLTRAVKKYAPPHIFRRSAKEKDPRQCHSDGDLSDTSVNLASSLEQHDLDTNAITSEPPAPVAPTMPDDDESSSSDEEF